MAQHFGATVVVTQLQGTPLDSPHKTKEAHPQTRASGIRVGLARALGAPGGKTPHTAHPCWPLGGQNQANLEQSPGARPGGPRRLLTSEGRVPGREVLALLGRTRRAPLCPGHRLRAGSHRPLGHTAKQEGPGHGPGCEALGTPGGSLYPFHRGGSRGVGETPHHCSWGHAGSPLPQPLPQAGQLPGTGGLRPVRGRPWTGGDS